MRNPIKMSKDYDKFMPHEVNRKVNEKSAGFKRLLASMSENGWLNAYPMHCVRSPDGKMKIKGGHNRFRAAQILGLSVKYVVENDSIPIHKLETAGGGPWKNHSFLYSHARQGIDEYIEMQEYIEKTGISLPLTASMFFGDTAGSGNWYKDGKFQLGEFKFKGANHAYTVANMVIFLREIGITYSHEQCFVIALSKVARVPAFSPDRFKKKAKQSVHLFEKKRTSHDYISLIEEVYNYKIAAKCKKNIAFQANQLAAERNVVLKNKKKLEVDEETEVPGNNAKPKLSKEKNNARQRTHFASFECAA